MGYARPALPAPRARVRAAGPAVAAFDSEMYAAERGEAWTGDADWAWLVPIGHQEPPGAAPVSRGVDVTPVLPAPSRDATGALSGQSRRGRGQRTVRWVNRNVLRRGR
jgi:hypothetical protein